jgi:hypothetical protein
MLPCWAERSIGIDADAVNNPLLADWRSGQWTITQQLVDPDGHGEWRFVAIVDLALAEAEGAPTLSSPPRPR